MKTSVVSTAGARMFFSIVAATLLAGFVFAFASVSQAKTKAPATVKVSGTAIDPVIELPKLEVRGERIIPQPEKFWNYSRFQNLEVLSDMGKMRTRSFIRQLGRYLNMIGSIFPPVKLNTVLPVKIILCEKARTFSQFGNLTSRWSSPMLVFRTYEQIVLVINTEYDPYFLMRGKMPELGLPDDWDSITGLLVAEAGAKQEYDAMDANANASMAGQSSYGGIMSMVAPGVVGAPAAVTGTTFRYTVKSGQEAVDPKDFGSWEDRWGVAWGGAWDDGWGRGAGWAGGWDGMRGGGMGAFRDASMPGYERGFSGFSPGYARNPGFNRSSEFSNHSGFNYGNTFSLPPFDSTGYALRLARDRFTGYYFEAFRAQGIPAWYESAMRQAWRSTHIWSKYIYAGQDITSITAMRKRAPLPMARIFERAPRDTAGDADLKNPWDWNTQSYAFVHYCLYRSFSKLRQGFAKFLDAACRGPVNETLFKECFKMSYADMEKALSAYAKRTYFNCGWYIFDDDPYPWDVIVRPATEAEIGRIKGEALMMAGKKFAAQQEFLGPYTRKTTDAQFLGAFGLHLLGNNNPEKARKLLEAAHDGGDSRARVCIALANLRMATALLEERKLHGDNAKLDAAETVAVLRPLSIALNQKPVLSAAYLLLAEVWKNSSVTPTPAQFNVIANGCRAFPYNMELIYRYTSLMADHGNKTEANAIAEQGLRLSRTVQDKRRFVALQARFNPSSAPPPPAATPSKPPAASSPNPPADPLSSLPSDPPLP